MGAGRGLEDNKCHSFLHKGQEGRSGKYRRASLSPLAGKEEQQIILEAISKHRKDKKAIGSS